MCIFSIQNLYNDSILNKIYRWQHKYSCHNIRVQGRYVDGIKNQMKKKKTRESSSLSFYCIQNYRLFGKFVNVIKITMHSNRLYLTKKKTISSSRHNIKFQIKTNNKFCLKTLKQTQVLVISKLCDIKNK